MPSVPLVLIRIIQSLDSDKASAHELEQLILHDPPLSARILRLANSAFYSFRSDVKTLAHAISLLGMSLVKSLAIGVNIFESFTRGIKTESTLINQLWMHSFGVGLVSQEIWARRSSRKEGDFAFLCGLLHDLGKAVFFKCDTSNYARIFSMEKGEEDPDIRAYEIDCYGMDHAGVGATLVQQWGLPPDLSVVIRKHHTAFNAGLPLVAAVATADMLAKQGNIGYDGDCRITADMEKLLAQLNMGPEEYELIVSYAAAKRKDAEDFFLLPSRP